MSIQKAKELALADLLQSESQEQGFGEIGEILIMAKKVGYNKPGRKSAIKYKVLRGEK